MFISRLSILFIIISYLGYPLANASPPLARPSGLPSPPSSPIVKPHQGHKTSPAQRSKIKSSSRAPLLASNSPRTHVLTLSGSAHHVSTGVYGRVDVTVRSTTSGIYRAEGSFDGSQISGQFETSGRRVTSCPAQQLCLSFNGYLKLKASKEWPQGTMTTFSLTLNFSKARANVVGVYQLGVLQGVDIIQMGTLNLKLNQPQKTPKKTSRPR